MPNLPTEDEQLMYDIWQVVKEDSLASSRIGSPSSHTRPKIVQLIHHYATKRELEARIDELEIAGNDLGVVIDKYYLKDRLTELKSQKEQENK